MRTAVVRSESLVKARLTAERVRGRVALHLAEAGYSVRSAEGPMVTMAVDDVVGQIVDMLEEAAADAAGGRESEAIRWAAGLVEKLKGNER
jgi:hypothetical protein